MVRTHKYFKGRRRFYVAKNIKGIIRIFFSVESNKIKMRHIILLLIGTTYNDGYIDNNKLVCSEGFQIY